MMYDAQLSRLDLMPATTYLAIKAKDPKEGGHNISPRIIFNIKATIIGLKSTAKKLSSTYIAFWASHHDGSSHTAWTLTMGESFHGFKEIDSPSSIVADIIANSLWIENFEALWFTDLWTFRYRCFFTFTKINLSAFKIITKTTETK